MNFTAEQINKAFENMPEILSKAISQIDLNQKKAEIIQKYKMHYDIADTLGSYITLFAIGLITPDRFNSNLLQNIGLSKDDSEKAIIDINNNIFLSIKEKMKEIEEKNKILDDIIVTEDKIPVPLYEQVVRREEEIPKPDYGKVESSGEIVSGEETIPTPQYTNEQEKNIYAQHGIEFVGKEKEIQKENKISNAQEKTILEDSGIDIIGDKLIAPTVNTTTTSDYSLPKIGK